MPLDELQTDKVQDKPSQNEVKVTDRSPIQ